MSDTDLAGAAPRPLRPAPTPLANYYRPGRNDHQEFLRLLSDGVFSASGVVADPCLEDRQSDLVKEMRRNGYETVLDPKSVELATVGGRGRTGMTELAWALDDIHTPALLTGESATQFVAQLADHAVEHEFQSVLAPTHFIASAVDPWLAVDASLTRALRKALNERGASGVPIYYPLVIHTDVFRDPLARNQLREHLRGLPIDSIWLRVHPFGTTNSGPLALRRYIEGARDLHALDIPLVAERTGTIGVALLAFSAVGGIESGVTFGERCDLSPLWRSRSGGFLPPPRIYLAEIGAFLEQEPARDFFGKRGMRSVFGCQTPGCCRRGADDMLGEPRRHFVIRRQGEIAALSQAPAALREGLYMESFVRPASDRAVLAARAEPRLDGHRRRLDSWRTTLSAIQQTDLERPMTYSAIPEGRRLRRGA